MDQWQVQEWEAFVREARSVLGGEHWVARRAVLEMDPATLPGEASWKMRKRNPDPHGAAKSLGKILSARQAHVVGDLFVERVGGGGSNPVKWAVTTLDEALGVASGVP